MELRKPPLPRAVILTALPCEYAAVREHLEDITEDVSHRSGKVYERGRFRGVSKHWEVLLAEVGTGNPQAATEAERAIRHFDPSLVLLVGIAGGLKDVRKGDVVAAHSVYGYESGKVQQTFKARPDVAKTTYGVRERARAESRKRDWQKRLSAKDRRLAPRVFLGAIAAGEKLLADSMSELRRFLDLHYNDALAIEMEGSGVLHAVHANPGLEALIVRGISDLIEDKTATDGEGWQETASRTASAFAFEVLSKFEGVSPSETADVWNAVLTKLGALVGREEYGKWFLPTRSVGRDGETINVLVPSASSVDHIRENHGARIREILSGISSEKLAVRFVVVSEDSIVPRTHPVLNPNYRFETFVVGKSNELAFAASKSISENPAGSYNPLFIYGESGLGKTHLLQAIAHEFLKRKHSSAVCYTSGDALLTELIDAIRADSIKEFRKRYLSVEALLLDDVHLLAGKERTQEEFFYIFNALHAGNIQIVFTSDVPPSAIQALEHRLRTRFEWGLVANIEPPDLETKVAIIRAKAEERKLAITNDVALFIAQCVHSNIRELEGHLHRVEAVAALHGSALNLATAREALKHLRRPTTRQR
jgi:chromosomal replication initiator protein